MNGLIFPKWAFFTGDSRNLSKNFIQEIKLTKSFNQKTMIKQKTRKVLPVLAVIILAVMTVNYAGATTDSSDDTVGGVESMVLSGSGKSVSWTVDGRSAQGFKVVWSKNTGPTYPCREGDQYHYYPDPDKRGDALEAFSGNGTYYVRVCEYLGGKCGKYSNEISLKLGETETCPIQCLVYEPVCGQDGKTYSCGPLTPNATVLTSRIRGSARIKPARFKKSLCRLKAKTR